MCAELDVFAEVVGELRDPHQRAVRESDVTAVGLAAQKALLDESIEHFFTRQAFTAAQPFRLRNREAQTRHLEVFSLDSNEQCVRHTDLQRITLGMGLHIMLTPDKQRYWAF